MKRKEKSFKTAGWPTRKRVGVEEKEEICKNEQSHFAGAAPISNLRYTHKHTHTHRLSSDSFFLIGKCSYLRVTSDSQVGWSSRVESGRCLACLFAPSHHNSAFFRRIRLIDFRMTLVGSVRVRQWLTKPRKYMQKSSKLFDLLSINQKNFNTPQTYEQANKRANERTIQTQFPMLPLLVEN